MIPLARPYFAGNELKYARNCIEEGWISSLGKFVTDFEQGFASYCGCRWGVSASNGTVALHLALKVLGIGPGDEVIVPDLTFVATANAVSFCGARPVFADSEEETWNIDPLEIEKKLTRRTKAIIVVHLYGYPARMDEILAIAKKRGLFVIEDACEAHGAVYRGDKVGGIGDMGVFSFYGNKIITTGEGGMLVTNNKTWDERARFLRDHAMSKTRRYFHPEIGYNYRLTNVQAAIGLAQLEKIDYIIAEKAKIAQVYNKLLKGIDGLSLSPRQDWVTGVCWLYSILVDGLPASVVMKKLSGSGIENRPFFIPMHKLPPYRTKGKFPVATGLSARGISLPSFVGIKHEEIEYICAKLRHILGGVR